MSEFECRCGGMMIRVEGRLTCEDCGGHSIAYMDGMNARQHEAMDNAPEPEQSEDDWREER